MSSGYYFLDYENPNAKLRENGKRGHYYPYRQRCKHGKGVHLLVVHTAENTPDWKPPDGGALRIAKYGASTTRSASWHWTTDSENSIHCLPDEFTAFHVIGYNHCSAGVEIATKAASWPQAPDWWTAAVLNRTAKIYAEWCKKWEIPVRKLTKAEADRGEKGIVAHATLDPSRRSDPGAGFDWGRFMALIQEHMKPTWKHGDPWTSVETLADARAAFKNMGQEDIFDRLSGDDDLRILQGKWAALFQQHDLRLRELQK